MTDGFVNAKDRQTFPTHFYQKKASELKIFTFCIKSLNELICVQYETGCPYRNVAILISSSEFISEIEETCSLIH